MPIACMLQKNFWVKKKRNSYTYLTKPNEHYFLILLMLLWTISTLMVYNNINTLDIVPNSKKKFKTSEK